jgi:RNA polymerase sigma factor (TIGR02999 family)
MTPPDVTSLLLRWRDGDSRALDEVTPIIYAELRRIAAHHLRLERRGHTLQATALVHEAFIHLIGRQNVSLETRGEFLAIASQLFRRVLVDHARKRHRFKRGGKAVQVTLHDNFQLPEQRGADLLRLDDALNALTAMSPRQGRIVEMKFFGGLEIEEIAAALGISPATVGRDWSAARAWLLRELQ